jgi:hypothetical protein
MDWRLRIPARQLMSAWRTRLAHAPRGRTEPSGTIDDRFHLRRPTAHRTARDAGWIARTRLWLHHGQLLVTGRAIREGRTWGDMIFSPTDQEKESPWR